MESLKFYYIPISNLRRLYIKKFKKFGMSARAYDKILKILRTIADLEGEETINDRHVAKSFLI